MKKKICTGLYVLSLGVAYHFPVLMVKHLPKVNLVPVPVYYYKPVIHTPWWKLPRTGVAKINEEISLQKDLHCIKYYESRGEYSIDTGNGYYGAYQFDPVTWDYVVNKIGFSQYANGNANLAPRVVQNKAALYLHKIRGWSPWPVSSVKCHLNS